MFIINFFRNTVYALSVILISGIGIANALEIILVNANPGDPVQSSSNNAFAQPPIGFYDDSLTAAELAAANIAAETLEALILDDVTIRIRVGWDDDMLVGAIAQAIGTHLVPIPYKAVNPINGVSNSVLNPFCLFPAANAELTQGYGSMLVADEEAEKDSLPIVKKLPLDGTNIVGPGESPFMEIDPVFNGVWADRDIGLGVGSPFWGPAFADPDCDATGLGEGYANCQGGAGTNCENKGAAELIWTSSALIKAVYSPETVEALEILGVIPVAGAPVGHDVDAPIRWNTAFRSIMDLNPDDGIDPGKFDFVGIMIHEIVHRLGVVNFANGRITVLGPNSSPLVGVNNLFYFADDDFSDNNMRDDLNANTFGDPQMTRSAVGAPEDGVLFAYFGENMTYFLQDGANNVVDGQHFFNMVGLPTFGVMDPSSFSGQPLVLQRADLVYLDAVGWELSPAWRQVSAPHMSWQAIRDLYINNPGEPQGDPDAGRVERFYTPNL